MNFGKLQHSYDERTIRMSSFIRDDVFAPSNYDFDKHRHALPLNSWGSNTYKLDPLAAQANYVMRKGRLNEHRTLPLREQDVINRYRALTGCENPGDANDKGISVLAMMKFWTQHGWTNANKFKIWAYGELEPDDVILMHTAVVALYGIFIGFWLPLGVLGNLDYWDYRGQTGREWKPGLLGGFLGYCKAYDQSGYEILGWGNRIRVTHEFVRKYCDEAWAVVENPDSEISHVVDVAGLTAQLESATKPRS